MATRRMSKRSASVDLMLRLPDQWIILNMAKRKKKLTPAQEAAKEERRKKFMFVFINRKQVRVRRPETIDGIDIHEFIRRNADPIWLHQHGMYELIDDDAF